MDQDDSHKRSAKQQALIRLNVREYSAGEMRSYLKRKAYREEEISITVAELVRDGLINDQRYSGILARHNVARGKGPGYLQSKLRQKGVKITSLEAKTLFQEFSTETELALARRIVDARYPKAFDNFKEKQRAYAGLLRRGISHETARLCLASPSSDAGPDRAEID